jgi:broad specificity phosphatase PhoE
VKDHNEGFMNADDFLAWIDKYDNMELEYCEVALPAKIDKVFVSRQQRAVKSAAYLALESEMSPKNLWLFVDRLRWYLNFRNVEKRSHTIIRARDFIEKINDIEDVLIVSHGLFMYVLIDELKKEGFEGAVDKKIKNAMVYTLERGVR